MKQRIICINIEEHEQWIIAMNGTPFLRTKENAKKRVRNGDERERKRDSTRANNAQVLQANSIFFLHLLRYTHDSIRRASTTRLYDSVEPSDFLVKEVWDNLVLLNFDSMTGA